MEEFNCLSELGKYAKDRDSTFQERVAEFFWNLIVKSGSKNRELIDSCSQKYRDMVRYWALERKKECFVQLTKILALEETPTIPCLKLLKGLIKDQSERTAYTPSTQTYPNNAGGSALRTRASDPNSSPEAGEGPGGEDKDK